MLISFVGRRFAASVSLAGVALFTACASAQIDFRGFSIPGIETSVAGHVSGDGRTVIGTAYDPTPPDTLVIRWTFEGGAEHLVEPAGFFAPAATAVSGDGSIILGGSLNGRTGFRWTRETGYVIQPDLSPRALSSDGAYEFGVLPTSSNAPYRRAHATGEVQPIGVSGSPWAASHDGSVVVGRDAEHLEGSGGAWRWTAATGQVSLGALPDGASRSEPRDVTPDGSVIVGYALYAEGNGAFRWTESAGYEALAMIRDAISTSATGVAADGRTIVGSSFLSDNTEVATIWLPDGSVHDFREYLSSLGADLTGWRLTGISGISDDGLTIAGSGVNPVGFSEGWVVRIPAPGSGALVLGLLLASRRREPRRRLVV